MSSEFPPNDPRNLWQNQPKEPFHMSAEEISYRLRRHQTKSRMTVLFAIALGVVLCAVFARSALRAEYLVTRIGWAALSFWTLYNAYQAYRWSWPRTLPSDPAARTSLAFYLGELEKRRDYVRHMWRRSGLTLCFFGLALIVGPGLILAVGNPRLLVNAAPFSIMIGAWLVVFFRQRNREQQKLKQEIDELRSFERENLT
jgi:hypothetical protein